MGFWQKVDIFVDFTAVNLLMHHKNFKLNPMESKAFWKPNPPLVGIKCIGLYRSETSYSPNHKKKNIFSLPVKRRNLLLMDRFAFIFAPIEYIAFLLPIFAFHFTSFLFTLTQFLAPYFISPPWKRRWQISPSLGELRVGFVTIYGIQLYPWLI